VALALIVSGQTNGKD